MKKILSIALVIVLTLCGCSGANEKSPKEITTLLTEELDLSGFTVVTGETLSHYFGFNSDDVKSFSFVVSEIDTSGDMIAAFEFENDNSKQLIIDGIGNYFSKTASVLKDNMTGEYLKIQNRILFEYNNIIILVVCGDIETAKTVLSNIGAKELV